MAKILCLFALLSLAGASKLQYKFLVDVEPLKMTDDMLAEVIFKFVITLFIILGAATSYHTLWANFHKCLFQKLGEGLIEEYMSLTNGSFKDISSKRNKNQACASEDYVEPQTDVFPWFIRHVRCTGIGQRCNKHDISFTCLQVHKELRFLSLC